MQPLEQVKILADALRHIGAIAVPTEEKALPMLIEAQKLADDALTRAGLVKKGPGDDRGL